MAILRASVVQACTAAFSLPDTLAKLKQYAKTAKDEGAQLVVFPEAFIGGYPKMELFGNAEEFVHYYQAAIDLPSPALTEIEATAKELGIFIVAGVIERDLGTLYCTAIFVDPVEGFVAKHRKTVPTTVERLVWGRGGPDTLPAVEKQFQATAAANGEAGDSVKVKISATICWENYMPLLRTFYYSKGTQIYCAPTVDDAEGWQHTMHHISLEGRCFVLAACQFAKEKDYPARGVDDASRDLEKVRLAGGSVIISPQGKVLAGPLRDQEGVLTADLDLEDIVRGKYKMDSVGHYSRPDIFKLQTLDVKEY